MKSNKPREGNRSKKGKKEIPVVVKPKKRTDEDADPLTPHEFQENFDKTFAWHDYLQAGKLEMDEARNFFLDINMKCIDFLRP